jgi:hypothetical protein
MILKNKKYHVLLSSLFVSIVLMIFVCYNILSILLQVDLGWVIVTHHIGLMSTSGAIWAHSRHIQKSWGKAQFLPPIQVQCPFHKQPN